MAKAIFSGAIQNRIYEDYEWCYFDPIQESQYESKITPLSEHAFFNKSDIIFICVKPQHFESVRQQFQKYHVENIHVISIMAGIDSATIRTSLDPQSRVTRVMPNTPAQIGSGISAIVYDPTSSAEERSMVDDLFLAVGEIVAIDEAMMNVVTAISGSGPAFVYRFIQDMITYANAAGINDTQSRKLACHTFIGAAKMVLKHQDVSHLIHTVSSPNGTTVAGLQEMDRREISDSFHAVLSAAAARATELEKGDMT